MISLDISPSCYTIQLIPTQANELEPKAPGTYVPLGAVLDHPTGMTAAEIGHRPAKPLGCRSLALKEETARQSY